jgi:GNAT superfamily N-acetyltransferase
MNRISSRLCASDADVRTMVDLMLRVRPLKYLNDYPRRVDIEENLMSSAVRANTRLWFDREQPVGWAYVDEFDNLRWEIELSHEERIGAEIVAWGESCIRKTLKEKELATLDASCRESYVERILFLERHGFYQTPDTTIYMIRPLTEPIPASELPPGFIIRALAGTEEAEEVAAMHRAAFGTNYMTMENRLAIMNTSEYDRSLDLVVVAPDGIIVANCICSVREDSTIGNSDPVATHPHYQRKGLARALLTRGMQLLKERAMLFAHLGTSDDNIAMQKTAESVGFTVEYKTLWFSKEVA